MAITVSKTKSSVSSKVCQETDKAAALPTKAEKINTGKSREVLLKAESRQ